MTAMFTDKFLESFQESIMKPGGYFGAVSPSFDTAFQVNRNVSTHLLSVFPASLVGVLCGRSPRSSQPRTSSPPSFERYTSVETSSSR